MYDAYHRVFERCGLTFRPVEAQSGEMGGDVNHEFMAVAAVGEDDFVWCKACDYAANVEAARRQSPDDPIAPAPDRSRRRARRCTRPTCRASPASSKFLGVAPSTTAEGIVFDVDGELGLAVVPGDREVNEFALAAALAPEAVRLFTDADFEAHPELPKGYIGPDFAGASVVVADPAIAAPIGWVTGANEIDHHVRNAVLGRDFHVDVWADLVTIVTGDACPRCGQPLSVDRGIEVGHVFQIGTKYSVALDANYTDEHGEQHPMVMGCYGIGVSRVVAAVVEEHHDEHGIAWPAALAPYDVHLVVGARPGRAGGRRDRAGRAHLRGARRARARRALRRPRREPGREVRRRRSDRRAGAARGRREGVGPGVVERKDRATGERDDLPLAEISATPASVRSGSRCAAARA